MRTIAEFFATLWWGLVQVFPILVRMWQAGGAFLRFAIFIAIAYPIIIVSWALIGLPWLTAIVSLLSAIAVISFLVAVVNPLFIVALGAINGGRRLLAYLATIIGLELLFSLYFVIVPVTNHYTMIPVFLLIVLTLVFLPSHNPNGWKSFVSGARMILIILAIGITILFFLWEFFPQATSKIGGLRGKLDGDLAALLDTSTAIRSKATPVSASTPVSTTIPSASWKRDQISIPLELKKGKWSEEINLFGLQPFRNHYNVNVAGDSAKIRFSDGTEFVICPSDTVHNFGHRPAIFKLMAFNRDAEAVSTAWNE